MKRAHECWTGEVRTPPNKKAGSIRAPSSGVKNAAYRSGPKSFNLNGPSVRGGLWWGRRTLAVASSRLQLVKSS